MKQTLFDVYTQDCHDRYVKLRDEERFSERKQACDQMWQAYEAFAEPLFKEEFARQPQQRFWEMYLGYYLLDSGFGLLPKKQVTGPDLCFQYEERKVWIEATAVDEGTGKDRVPKVSEHSGYDPIPDDKIVLRFTNAIADKYRKLLVYRSSGLVADDDPFVIAINAAQIDMSIFNFDFPIPLVLKAVYPLGQHLVQIDPISERVVRDGYLLRLSIAKESGSPVETNLFLDPSYSSISGILYSLASFWDLGSQSSENLVYVHNDKASSPLPFGWVQAGRDCWKEGNSILIKATGPFA
jgi:hypothetical protein